MVFPHDSKSVSVMHYCATKICIFESKAFKVAEEMGGIGFWLRFRRSVGS